MPQPEVTPLQRLTKVLKLGTPSTYRDHTYVNGESLYFPTGRVYGGQVIAQSLIAASKTVDRGCAGSGDADKREGNHGTVRGAVVVCQVLCAEVAVRHPARYADHHAGGRYEECPQGFRQADGLDEGGWRGGCATSHASCDACDQVMLEPVLRRAGLSIATPGISFASIDHSMWWYRDIDINQWHLYVQDTPTAAHGRGLGQAKVYTQDGTLVACMAQEAMIRVPQEDLR